MKIDYNKLYHPGTETEKRILSMKNKYNKIGESTF